MHTRVPASDLVRAPVPASVLNREDGKRYIVLSEHVTVSVPGCVPGSNTGGAAALAAAAAGSRREAIRVPASVLRVCRGAARY